MSNHVFDCVLVNTVFFCHGYKVSSSIVWSMLFVKPESFYNVFKCFLVTRIGKVIIPFSAVIRIWPIQKVVTSKVDRLFIFLFNEVLDSAVNRNHTIFSSICLHSASERPVFKIHVFELD